MIRVRERNGITEETDNGYNRAGVPLRRAIARYRIDAGLEQPSRGADIDRGYGIGD